MSLEKIRMSKRTLSKIFLATTCLAALVMFFAFVASAHAATTSTDSNGNKVVNPGTAKAADIIGGSHEVTVWNASGQPGGVSVVQTADGKYWVPVNCNGVPRQNFIDGGSYAQITGGMTNGTSPGTIAAGDAGHNIANTTVNSANPETEYLTKTTNGENTDFACNIFSWWSPVSTGTACAFLWVLQKFIQLICWAILAVFSFLVWIAGQLLDLVIAKTVLNMTATVSSMGTLTSAWTTARDVANMFFIFVLLYAAIKQIIQGVGAANTIKWVIIIALLLNFSLFFTELIIDASNQVSIGFYDLAIGQPLPNGKPSGGDIGAIFMQNFNLQTIYTPGVTNTNGTGVGAASQSFSASNNPTQTIVATFFGVVVMSIAVVVFLAAAIMFIYRFVVLLLLMAFSPLAYVAMILPNGRSYSDRFWKPLANQCIAAPVFMLFLYMAIKIISGMSKVLGATNFGFWELIQGKPGAVAYILNFAIVIAFMIAPLVAAREFGAAGADWGLKTVKKLAGGLAGGVGGYTGRFALGRPAAWVDKKLENAGWANNKYIGTTVRGIRGMTTGALATAKFGSAQSRADITKMQKEIAGKKEEIDTKKQITNSIETIRNAEANIKAGKDVGENTKIRAAAEGKIKETIDKMSNKQLESLGTGELKSNEVLQHLDPGQFEYLTSKSEKSESDKAAIKAARTDLFKKSSGSTLKNLMSNMTGNDLVKIAQQQPKDAKTLLTRDDVIKNLKTTQMKDMEDLDEDIRNTIGTEIRKLQSHRAYQFVDSGAGKGNVGNFRSSRSRKYPGGIYDFANRKIICPDQFYRARTRRSAQTTENYYIKAG